MRERMGGRLSFLAFDDSEPVSSNASTCHPCIVPFHISPLPSPVETHHRKGLDFGRGTHHFSRCPRPKERGADEVLSWASISGGPLGGWQAALPWPAGGQTLASFSRSARAREDPSSPRLPRARYLEQQKWSLCEQELQDVYSGYGEEGFTLHAGSENVRLHQSDSGTH